MTKTEAIKGLTEGSYSKLFVMELINRLEGPTSIIGSKRKPSKLKIGDIILSPVGLKTRPCVIIKIKEREILVHKLQR